MPSEHSPIRLRALLSDYPSTRALRAGVVPSPLIHFDFAAPKVLYAEFKPLISELKYDVAELPVTTFLQAHQYGKKLVLLPFIMNARFQHDCLVYNSASGPLDIGALQGKRIGVRSYTQTTVAWLRGILQDDYGLDPANAVWVTISGSHLEEYTDPANCQRAAAGKTLEQMLLDGEIDAAVLAPGLYADPRIKPLIPNGQEVALDWFRRTQIRPMNHMVVVGEPLAQSRPDVVAELYRVLVKSKKAAPLPAHGIDLGPPGIEASRRSLEAIIDYAFRSGVIERRFSVDELFSNSPFELF